MKPKTVIFIHGMYMTPLCWEKWLPTFEARGFKTMAPAWPGRDRPVQELRQRHPDPELGKLTLRQVVDHYARLVRSASEPPILIGHSMGGLVVQLLLQREKAAAGVALDSAPPLGVVSLRWSFLKSNGPHVNPFVALGRPISMTFERFQYTFVNGLPMPQQRAAYDRYVVPESRRVPAQSLTPVARIDFRRAHPPLLLIAGSADNLIPASLIRANHARYRRSPSRTDLREFPGRTHFLLGQEGWEDVAESILQWLDVNVP